MSASYQPIVWTLARPPISTLPELGVTQAQDAENDRALVDRVQAGYRAARQVYAGSASAWDVTIGEIKRPIRSPSRKAAEAHLTIRQRVRETETRASRDKTARLWDAATGKAILVLSGHDGPVNSAAFSPDGARVVTASEDKTARVWDAVTGAQIVVLRGHDDAVWSAVFSPDGARVVAASGDKTARLWDAATGKAIAVLAGHDAVVHSVAFSRDGTRVVTASRDKTARIWDVSSIPKGNLFQIACAWLPDYDLTGVAREYGLINLAPICDGDPLLPDRPPD